MKIVGIERCSTVDFPQHIAAVLFLHGCNWRCGYCHNPLLVNCHRGETFSTEYILEFLEKRKGILDGVCITGGEPLISLDIEFLKKIKEMGYAIKIDTNGCFPQRLKPLIDAKLVDYVAMDLKNSPKKYEHTVNRPIKQENIEQSVRLISTLPAYEFRTTVVPTLHTKQDIVDIVQWLAQVTHTPKLYAYYLQQFIPRANNMLDPSFEKVPSQDTIELEAMRQSVKDSFVICETRTV
ncbi:MAG TPA: anaerobic ribonucleoside-triphosphate reductase activating protein [Acidobacteriota bacterium]|nr:anaerobic ribonucleoside-triphosphate reductase activating protein [Acidobacteriota bacterium]